MIDKEMTAGDDAHGGVIWLTGYSSAGKTSLGRVVTTELRKRGKASVFLDGDDLRGIFGNKWGYTDDERRELTRVYFRLCSHIASQGQTVVIAAAAMFESAFAWFRENVPGGMLVYLDVPEEVRRRRDAAIAKGVYDDDAGNAARYDIPSDPDLILANPDGVDLRDSADRILADYAGVPGRHPDRGRADHWESFYSTSAAPLDPSPFAIHVGDLLPADGGLRILEVGCGNGRDAAYLASMGFEVTAVDTSPAAIDLCKATHGAGDLTFVHGAIAEMDPGPAAFHIVYSRFVLHAMTLDEEQEFLSAAAKTLQPGGRLFIECRSIRDSLARKGEVLSPTERIHGHYRRFIVPEELSSRIAESGLEVESMIESNGLATFPGEDPVVVRLAARKPT